MAQVSTCCSGPVINMAPLASQKCPGQGVKFCGESSLGPPLGTSDNLWSGWDAPVRAGAGPPRNLAVGSLRSSSIHRGARRLDSLVTPAPRLPLFGLFPLKDRSFLLMKSTLYHMNKTLITYYNGTEVYITPKL